MEDFMSNTIKSVHQYLVIANIRLQLHQFESIFLKLICHVNVISKLFRYFKVVFEIKLQRVPDLAFICVYFNIFAIY